MNRLLRLIPTEANTRKRLHEWGEKRIFNYAMERMGWIFMPCCPKRNSFHVDELSKFSPGLRVMV
jgi:hypothetical protein